LPTQDPLTVASGSLPAWCAGLTRWCGFLFPLETRLLHLQVTASGLARALTAMQMRLEQAGSAHNEELRVARLQRVKVRVARDKVLAVCTKVMDRYAASPAVLEVEYKGEVGTGLGPTLEFYAVASRAFVDDALGLWRDCHNVMGLYPAPAAEDPVQVHIT
jgi:E3 ubiquitin-protein ligase TRIP12